MFHARKFLTLPCMILATAGAMALPPEEEAESVIKHETGIVYDFLADSQGWNFYSPAGFTPSSGVYNSTAKRLDVITGDNSNSFAFWESPVFSLLADPGPPPGRRSAVTKGLPGRLFRTRMTVSTDSADRSVVPGFRMRTSSYDFQQTSVYVVSSIGDVSTLPVSYGYLYRQFFVLPEGQDYMRMDWDVINFDPNDLANGQLALTRVNIQAVDPIDYGAPSETTSFDFRTGSNGFTSRTAAPTFAATEFPHSPTLGLGIRQHPDKGTGEPAVDFGFWGKEDALTIHGDSIYRFEWIIESDATPEQRAQVPTFRLRMNNGSLQYSAYINVDARNADSIIPVVGQPQAYDLWVRALETVPQDSAILSFDFIGTGADGEDPKIGVYLRELNVYRHVFQ